MLGFRIKQAQNASDRLPLAVFSICCVILGVAYGIAAMRYSLFPVPMLRYANAQLDALTGDELREKSIDLPGDDTSTKVLQGDALSPGLILVTGMSEDLVNFARIVDRHGAVVHEWRPDWFAFPTDGLAIPEDRRPISPPGSSIHGVAVMPDGDLVFNFEHLTTMRLDACGNMRWMLDNLGHHSVERDDDGSLWVSAERVTPGKESTVGDWGREPVRDWVIQKISPEGEILRTISVIDILTRNDLMGLLYLSNLSNEITGVGGDTLHLNDVEVFPRDLPEGVFKHGDLMVSLRNINTVLIFDPETLRARYRTTGAFLRQHDPDFVSGNRFIVFDNRNLPPDADPVDRQSRILAVDAAADTVTEVYGLQDGDRYFTDIMGKHQRLPNGNLLITVSWEGRAIEVTPAGKKAWEYINAMSTGARGIITEATLLPPEMDAVFFEQRRQACGHQIAGSKQQ